MRRIITMKTKKFSKKLALSKQTIANLGNGKMNMLKGGATGTCDTCGTCDLTGDPCVQCMSVWPLKLSVCICED